jgi:hypothetical protein
MPNIRNKSLQSRRVGSALNGLAEFDQTDWSGDYAQVNGDWTGGAVYAEPSPIPDTPPNLLSDLFNFGAKLLTAQTATPAPSTPQIRYAAGATPRQKADIIMPLLIAGVLAATYFMSRK